MDANQIKRQMTELFSTLADGLESDGFPREVRVALTGIGSEHGEEEMMAAAVQAREAGIHVLYLGTLQAGGVETVSAPLNEQGFQAAPACIQARRQAGGPRPKYDYIIKYIHISLPPLPSFFIHKF